MPGLGHKLSLHMCGPLFLKSGHGWSSRGGVRRALRKQRFDGVGVIRRGRTNIGA